MAKSVGIEISETRVALVELESNSQKRQLSKFAEKSIQTSKEKPWQDAAGEALASLFTENKVSLDKIVVSIDSNHAIIREIQVPFKGDEQVRKVARFELENHIHNYSIEDLIIDFYKTGEFENGTNLTAFAMPKDIMSTHIELLDKNGVDPIAVDIDASAIFNALSQLGQVGADEPFVIVHSNAKFTKLIFVEGRKPKYVRTYRLNIPPDLEKASDEELESILGILAKEISRFLLASTAISPNFILTSGILANDKAIGIVEKKTSFPAKKLNLADTIENLGQGDVTAPLGLALKAEGLDVMGLDFRKEEFAYKRKFEAVRTPLIVAMSAIILILVFMFFGLATEKMRIQKAYNEVLSKEAVAFKNITSKEPESPQDALSELQSIYREKNEKLGGGEYPIEKSSLIIWRELYEMISRFKLREEEGAKNLEENLDLAITDLFIEQSKCRLTLKGKVTNRTFAEKLRNTLRENEMFKNADFDGALPVDSTGKVSFAIGNKEEKGEK